LGLCFPISYSCIYEGGVSTYIGSYYIVYEFCLSSICLLHTINDNIIIVRRRASGPHILILEQLIGCASVKRHRHFQITIAHRSRASIAFVQFVADIWRDPYNILWNIIKSISCNCVHKWMRFAAHHICCSSNVNIIHYNN